ncbi:MAG: class I SAM-dependent methyltransferase [Rhodospirillales bacterium]|nr:class I SAM-dependent methyltransferase [Rhodospirillales bacterium]
MIGDPVKNQYEAYPYPPRNPADEARRLVTGSPSHLDELNHCVFGGRRDFSKPFRALVAGGGTGDAAIMLAQQLMDRGAPAEIVYVDTSDAAKAIAEARAQVRGLNNIRFVGASLLELPALGFEPFDYIDCCGVLHHLPEPAAGMEALTAVLATGGGMGLMLYGELGRTGVYPFQGMMAMLATAETAGARLEWARRLVAQLPETNWLRRNPFVKDHLSQGDSGFYDLLLHERDRAFWVPEIAALTAAAGLRITAFIEPAFYDPASYLKDPRLIARVSRLSWLERCAFAELLAGNMRKHVFYVVAADNPVAPPSPEDKAAIPILRDLDPAELASGMSPGTVMSATVDGITIRRPLPPLSAAILNRIDGRLSLNEIHEHLRQTNAGLGWSAFSKQFTALYDALHGLGKLYLAFR